MFDPSQPVAVLAAGSWGTALAMLLGRKGLAVRLWARRPELARQLQQGRRNPTYLAQYDLPETVAGCETLAEAVAGVELVVLAPICAGLRPLMQALRPHLQPEHWLVSTTKGLELGTGLRPSQVIQSELPEELSGRMAVLSGPNLAAEVAAGLPSTAVAASPDHTVAQDAQAAFMCPLFRVYSNPDMVGVERGGALKNVIALGAGLSDGMGFGDNARAALMTRGLAEITRLGVAMGAQPATFRGLSGVGDLMATCSSKHSRNYRVGCALAGGAGLAAVLAEMAPQIPEGVSTTEAACQMAEHYRVEMPITQVTAMVLRGELSAREGARALMARTRKDELEEEWLRTSGG